MVKCPLGWTWTLISNFACPILWCYYHIFVSFNTYYLRQDLIIWKNNLNWLKISKTTWEIKTVSIRHNFLKGLGTWYLEKGAPSNAQPIVGQQPHQRWEPEILSLVKVHFQHHAPLHFSTTLDSCHFFFTADVQMMIMLAAKLSSAIIIALHTDPTSLQFL